MRNSTNTYDFTYTNNGRLASASLNGTQVGTYIDNGLGQRVAKTAYGVTNHYLFDRFGHLLAENDGMGTPIREYIWLDDLPVAMIDHTGASPVTYYIHTDQLGRPQKMTDASANLVWDAIFQPFGEVYAVSGSASNFLMFPGQFYDGETQLSQNWHRDYDPTIGRYIQSDPIGLAGGINTYSYVGGNPLTRIDPTGKNTAVLTLCAEVPEACAGFGIGASLAWAVSPAGQAEIQRMSHAVSKAIKSCFGENVDCEQVHKTYHEQCVDQ